MKSKLLQALFNIRYSYWFIPSMMALAAAVLAVLMVAVDIYYLEELPQGYEWLFSSQPEGARALLSTVAGSTITVAGVVFSMTLMSVSHATSNYGSRLLLTFLKDRQNQFALGTFIATFIYCLLVLRTVSNADSGTDYNGFIPHLAILGGLGLALASVVVLIAFIHHVPDTIHIGAVASNRGKELISRLDAFFPPEEHAKNSLQRPIDGYPYQGRSQKTGYIQTLDLDGLVRFCAENDMAVNVLKQPGDFVYPSSTLLEYQSLSGRQTEKIEMALGKFYGMGDERTPAQDVRFLIEELSQIAVRALSPGINDPFTAITCLDWLGASVAHVANRAPRSACIADRENVVRVSMPQFKFDDLCHRTFRRLREYITSDITVSFHMLEIFSDLLDCLDSEERKNTIRDHANHYFEEAHAKCSSEQKSQELAKYFQQLFAN